jgi:sulfite exporter TauE/SafE
MAALLTVLLVSLSGSLHCAGMCGPLVAFALGSTETQSHGMRWLLQLAYHGGRLFSYALIGALCGLLGAALDMGAALLGLRSVAVILAGSMMIAVGLIAILRYSGLRLPHVKVPGALQRVVVLGQRAAIGLRPFPRALTIGLLSALLPCGWLYAFAIVATGAGSAAMGAAVMAAFWLGTVPVLASLGIGVQAFSGTLGRRMPLITAVAIVVLGLFTIVGRLSVPVAAFEQQQVEISTSGDVQQQVETIDSSTPPCCQERNE